MSGMPGPKPGREVGDRDVEACSLAYLEGVPAAAPRHRVDAAAQREQDVVAAPAVQGVVAAGAVNRVVACASDKKLVAPSFTVPFWKTKGSIPSRYPEPTKTCC